MYKAFLSIYSVSIFLIQYIRIYYFWDMPEARFSVYQPLLFLALPVSLILYDSITTAYPVSSLLRRRLPLLFLTLLALGGAWLIG